VEDFIMPSYSEVAKQYAEGVLQLMMPVAAHATHISQRSSQSAVAVMSYNAVATQARALLGTSRAVTHAAAERLTSPNPQIRIEAQMQLLTKALTDLAVSQHLLDAAEDEKIGIMPQIASQRSAALFAVDDYLKVLVNGPQRRNALRNAALPSAYATPELAPAEANLGAAKLSLVETLNDAFGSIVTITATHGKAAFAGLLGLGLGNLAKAVGIVGQDVAKILGQGAQASELYRLVNEYVAQAYETILKLIGAQLSGVIVDKALDFFGELKDGALLEDLLVKIYDIDRMRNEMADLIDANASAADNVNRAREDVSQLVEQFKQTMDFVGQLMTGLKYVGMIPLIAMPQAQLVMSASYAILFAYTVLNGADYADASRVKLLNRVPGVRDLVTASLLSQG
jgi:hypothetical protein